MNRDPNLEFAVSLGVNEAAAALLSGKGTPVMLAALKSATHSPNPRIRDSAETFLQLFHGCPWRLIGDNAGDVHDALPSDTEASNVVTLVMPQPAAEIIDFDSRNLRRDLAKAATYPAPGGFDPLNDGAA
jgi:hypothetical protein